MFSIFKKSFKLVSSGGKLIHSQPITALCKCYGPRLLSSKSSSNIILEKDLETGEVKKKKTTIIPKITLLHGNDINVTTLEEAQKIAKRRSLKLVKLIDIDTKTQKPVYRLMSGSEYYQEELNQKEKKKLQKENSYLKGEKLLTVNQNISEHDLQTNIAKIIKWLTKKYEVRLVINGNSSSMKNAENVYSFLDSHLKSHGRIIQKRQKGSEIKFQVLPPKEDKDNEKNYSTEKNNL